MAKYSGKDEKINGKWYPVTVTANSEKEAIKKLKVGQRKSYGTVSAIRGRFSKEENSGDFTKIKFGPKKPKFRKDFVLKTSR